MSRDNVFEKELENHILVAISTILSILFCILGTVGMIFSGFWFASITEYRKLIQSKEETIEDESSGLGIGFDSMAQLSLSTGVIAGLQCVMSFVVCCGSCCEFRSVIKSLAVFVSFLALLNLAVLLLGNHFYINEDGIVRVLRQNLIDKYTLFGEATEMKTVFTYRMDRFQVTKGCCGAGNYTDYTFVRGWLKSRANSNQLVPLGCCKLSVYDFLFEQKLTLTAGCCTEKPTANNSNVGNACGYVMVKEMQEYLQQGCITSQSVGLILSKRDYAWHFPVISKHSHSYRRPASSKTVVVKTRPPKLRLNNSISGSSTYIQ